MIMVSEDELDEDVLVDHWVDQELPYVEYQELLQLVDVENAPVLFPLLGFGGVVTAGDASIMTEYIAAVVLPLVVIVAVEFEYPVVDLASSTKLVKPALSSEAYWPIFK